MNPFRKEGNMRPIAGAIVLLAAALLLIAGTLFESQFSRSPYPVLYIAALGMGILGLVLIFRDS